MGPSYWLLTVFSFDLERLVHAKKLPSPFSLLATAGPYVSDGVRISTTPDSSDSLFFGEGFSLDNMFIAWDMRWGICQIRKNANFKMKY